MKSNNRAISQNGLRRPQSSSPYINFRHCDNQKGRNLVSNTLMLNNLKHKQLSLTPRDIEETIGGEESFKVYVRVRPLNDRELYCSKSSPSIVKVQDNYVRPILIC